MKNQRENGYFCVVWFSMHFTEVQREQLEHKKRLHNIKNIVSFSKQRTNSSNYSVPLNYY